MCMGGSPKAPAKEPVLPEAAETPDPNSSRSISGSDADKRRRANAAGRTGTILTSSRGITDNSPTRQKTLLGA